MLGMTEQALCKSGPSYGYSEYYLCDTIPALMARRFASFGTVATLLSLLSSQAIADSEIWRLDAAQTSVVFSAIYLKTARVTGSLRCLEGEAHIDEREPAKSRVVVKLASNSIDTRNSKRDAYLRSSDFLDAAKFPTLTFESSAVTESGNGRLKITGPLTIRGVSRPVTIDGQLSAVSESVERGVERLATFHGTMRRSDYGLTWDRVLETAGFVVSNEVAFELRVRLTRQ